MKYAAFLTIWIACYLIPQTFGPWYDQGFSAFQACVSLFLLIAAYKLLGPKWWVEAYSWCCVIAIIMNIGDALMDYPPEAYNRYQEAINIFELVCLLIFPFVTRLWIHWHGAGNHDHDGPVSRVSHKRVGQRLG